MRSIYDPGQLLLVSKKPRIKELVEASMSMTIDEIKSLDEKPDVIRGLLLIRDLGTTKGTISEKVADKMIELHGIHLSEDYAKTEGSIYTINSDLWLNQGLSSLEIKTGWYWIRTIDEKILISSSGIFNSTTDLIIQLIDNSTFLSQGIVGDFYKLDYDRRSKLM